jgi:nucleoside 2-deoxyribosyltransferase
MRGNNFYREGDVTMAKAYIAGWFGSQKRLKKMAEQLVKLVPTTEIVSTWLDEKEDEPEKCQVSDFTSEYLQTIAIRDVNELHKADGIIVDTIDSTPRGGREVELGVMLGLGRPIVVIGPRRNVFHFLPMSQVDHFDTWEEFFAYLSAMLSIMVLEKVRSNEQK